MTDTASGETSLSAIKGNELTTQPATNQQRPQEVPPADASRKSTLVIELPPNLQATADTPPDTQEAYIDPLLSQIHWDPLKEQLTLPSGLEISEIEIADAITQILLADGTRLIIEGHSDQPPAIQFENQTLTAQEIQTLFAAVRNVEPSAGPETSSGSTNDTTPASGNTEPASPLPAPDELTGSGNDFEPIPIAVQPSFPITPLLLPSERSQDFLEQDLGYAELDISTQNQSPEPSGGPQVKPTFFSGSTDDVYEAGLASGTTAGKVAITTSGPLNIDSGSSPLQSLEVCDPTQNVWLDMTNGGQITTSHGTYTITANSDGTYNWSYTLSTPGNHNVDSPQDILKLRITNTEGSQASADIQVNIIDDAPVIDIANTPASIPEGQTLNGNWSLNPGADGVTHITVSLAGQPDQTIALSENTPATFTLPKGTLTVNPDGSYSFTAANNLDNDSLQQQSFTLTATDSDGDTTSDSHTISITDGTSPKPPQDLPGETVDLILTVNEAALDTTKDQEDLATGNTEGSNPTGTGETDISSTLTFTAGSDDLTSFAFGNPAGITITNGAATLNVSWTLANGQLIGSVNGSPAIILALDASNIPAGQQGSVKITATLTDNFPHDASGNPIKINGITINASDHDGDTVSADIQVNIIDDAPVIDIADTPASIPEGQTLNGNWSLNPGADGVTHITVSLAGQPDQTIALSENTPAIFTLPKGTLTVNPDGSYSFTAANNLDNHSLQQQSFTLTATDSDGDTTSDSHTISITDGTSPKPPQDLPGETVDLILTVNEAALDTTKDQEDLAAGNTEGSNPTGTGETDISSTLTFTAGSDDLTSFAFGNPAGITITNGAATLNVSWTLANGQLIGSVNGSPAIILALDASNIPAGQQGSVKVTATLTDNFPHDASGNPIKINGITINASDHDGDTVSADIQVNIIDDAPVIDIADTPASIPEGQTLNGNWSLNPGADGVTHITVSLAGQPDQTIALSENTPATFTLPKGTLTVNPDGTYSFTAANNLDNDSLQQQSFILTATDSDGDITTDSHTISITDGTSPIGGDIIALNLDESALDGNPATGDAAGSNPASTAETQGDMLRFTAGSDEIVGFTIGDTSSITVKDDSGTVVTSISWALSADKQILTGSIAGQAVIQLKLTGTSIAVGQSGTVQVNATLLSEFPHVTNGTSDFTILGVPIVATDKDGTTALGFTNISIKDDNPDIDIADTQNVVTEGETISDSFSLSSGADGYTRVTVYTDVNDQHEVNLAPNDQTTLYTKQGQLTLNSDGTWEFTAATGLDFPQLQTLQFFISVEDGDGDKDTDSHLISIKQAAVPILGTTGNDVLTGSQTSELIKGLDGNDTIKGMEGRDKIAGMGGEDTLEGGADSDTFVLDLSNLTIPDLITDYDSSGLDADKLDVTQLIGSEQITQQNVGDYFQLSGGILSFDQDGAGTNHSMVQVMKFSSPPAQVELVIDETQAPLVITA